MTDRVHIDFRKYPDTPHWQYPMRTLATDGYGTWLWAPAGTPTRRGDEPPTPASALFVKLVDEGAWHSAIWNESGKYSVYVDINTPPRFERGRIQMIDLDLDVVRFRSDGTVAILDEDEFSEHQRTLRYPPHLVDGARAAAASVHVSLESGAEPFGRVGIMRLEQARALADGGAR